jgi:hypothetical protein
METFERESSQNTKIGKKKYHSPGLIYYGDLREITQTVGTMGADDGAHGTTKTG